jgi:hypothetical protein
MRCTKMIPGKKPKGGGPRPKMQCQGTIEASTKIYLDVEAHNITPSGAVIISDLTPSRLNDHYDGMPLNVESELYVSCSDCGAEYEVEFAQSATLKMGLQPIGDAERVTGLPRGGR